MATDAQPKPSFSPYHKWRIGFQVSLILLLVLSVVVVGFERKEDIFGALGRARRLS